MDTQELDRVLAAARDATSDEMVARLAGSAAEAMDLLDRAGRSGLAQAIPVLADMVRNGDLERLSQLARVHEAAQDALTDEMVGRLSGALGEGLTLLDRLNRSGIGRLVALLEQLESTGQLQKLVDSVPVLVQRLERLSALLDCLEGAAVQAGQHKSTGGLGGIWQLMTDARTQQSLQFLVETGKLMQERCSRQG